MRLGLRRFGLAALLVLAALTAALAEQSFAHTDDGCQVEIHCLACRWAAVSTVLSAPAVVPAAAVLVELGRVVRSQVSRVAPVTGDATSLRGPPSL